nr:hypothetical protein [Tanacetum cinerariifolium]
MDEALVPHAKRLRIGRRNFRQLSDIKSKESTLQLVYDVMRLCPFFKAFLVTADVPEIYMDMLHICPRIPGQSFVEPSFEEEILAFIRFLGHSAVIRKLIDVNINKLYQPWRSFIAIINKCLTEKSFGYDSLRLSQAQILMQQTHISQASGSGADKGTGSIPGVLNVPIDESEEELSWNSTKDEGDDDEGKDGDGDEEDDGDNGEEGDGDDDEDDEGDDDDDDQEIKRDDEKDDEEDAGDDEQDSD